MRNIALLEWGPASLYYLQPRERIKVRTQWLEAGPVMPSFLSTTEEAKGGQESGVVIRYALSTFEDLNHTIRNVRRCFGFPYQEYIGYLNTHSRTHRARREHEVLIDRMRRWAMALNIDAVVWIDYAKANQPQGSFRVGPRDSRPFSSGHMEMCAHVIRLEQEGNNDDDSEAWSEADDDANQHAGNAAGAGGVAASATVVVSSASVGGANEGSKPASGGEPYPNRHKSTTGKFFKIGRLSEFKARLTGHTGDVSGEASAELSRAKTSSSGEKSSLRTVLQEEVIPAHGSIYTRSIAPGPGYYDRFNRLSAIAPTDGVGAVPFKSRPRCTIDDVVARTKDMPGVGEYEPKPAMAEAQVAGGGRFGRAMKTSMMHPLEAARKLPFISPHATASEQHGLHSPTDIFHSVHPEIPYGSHSNYERPPKFTFGKSRRLH